MFRRREVEEIKKIFLYFLLILGLGGLIFSIVSILQKSIPYFDSARQNKELQEIYEEQGKGPEEQSDSSNRLMDINEDYVGWIKIKDTKINYPVVKTDNNVFYLNHNFNKEKDKSGSIFMDYQNSDGRFDKNIIIYGHNMKDSSMFGGLKKFQDLQYIEEHPFITLDFRGITYEWEIFAVYTSKDTSWMRTSFVFLNEFEEFLSTIKSRSTYNNFGINVNSKDHVLTLSTCTNIRSDERIIVHAKLITKEIDLENAT